MISANTLTFGAALMGLAAAAPAMNPWDNWASGPSSSAAPAAPPFAGSSSVAAAPASSTSYAVSAGGAQLQSGNPFSFPLPNGFPNLSADQKSKVNVLAHGIEPNGGAPTLGADDLTSIQLIAFNEIFEVAFFTSLLFNVTNNVAGFTVADATQRTRIINALTAIQAQEELHADNANAILSANKIAPIQACKYQFPTSNLPDALALASTFTDVVLGTLQDVQFHLASNGAAGVVPIIGSVIGQEGEQNGFFRSLDPVKIPSAKPFLTRSDRAFAFSALNQAFVVPGSCPNSNTINLPVFQPLTVVTTNIQPKDQQLTFSVPTSKVPKVEGLSIVYINGQTVPLFGAPQQISYANGVATFKADFPYTQNVMDGLTIAALVSSTANLKTAEDVAKVAVFGPGLIEIN